MMPWENELVTPFFLFVDVIGLQHDSGHAVPDAIGMTAAEWRHAWLSKCAGWHALFGNLF